MFFAHLSKGYGKSKKWQFQGRLTTIYEKVFRIDTFMDEQGEMAVLLDREDNIIETMQLRDSLDFVERFDLPVSQLGFRGRFDTTQYVMLEDGLITTISEKIA